MSARVHIRVARRRPLWGVTIDGHDVAVRRTQLVAWRLAVAIAKALEAVGLESQATLTARNGRVVTERTYPRSSDPRETEG